MATFTSNYALASVQPRGVHVGMNVAYSVYSASATLSNGDVIWMCKVPDNARIIDTILTTGDSLAGSPMNLSVGTPAAATKFIASASSNAASQPIHMNVAAGLGAVLDVSDSGGAKFTVISVTATNSGTSGTASAVITLAVLYHIDQYIPGITP